MKVILLLAVHVKRRIKNKKGVHAERLGNIKITLCCEETRWELYTYPEDTHTHTHRLHLKYIHPCPIPKSADAGYQLENQTWSFSGTLGQTLLNSDKSNSSMQCGLPGKATCGPVCLDGVNRVYWRYWRPARGGLVLCVCACIYPYHVCFLKSAVPFFFFAHIALLIDKQLTFEP